MSYELIASTDYLPLHNVFLIHIDMSQYLLEFYVQRKDFADVVTTEQDSKLKDLIACFSIHLAARTTLETHAWTLSIVNEHPYSLFVTGNTGEIDESGIAKGFLVGNVLTENIRHSDTNGFHAQCTGRGKTFNSYVSCESPDVTSMVENFYAQSEQRPIRIKLSGTNDTAIGLAALPGYEPEWFSNVNIEELSANSEKIEKTRMRNCKFTFACDCSPEKLLPFFRTLTPEAVSDLYGEDQELLITCPRCGRKFAVDRSLVETKKEELN